MTAPHDWWATTLHDTSAEDGGRCVPTIIRPREGDGTRHPAEAHGEPAHGAPLPPGTLLGGALFLLAILITAAACLTFLAIILGIAWEWIAG